MRLRVNRAVRSFGLPAVLLALLPLLAVLQYRWIGRLSEAERERMETNLRVASSQFAREFDRAVTHAAASFLLSPPAREDGPWDRFARRHEAWLESAPDRGLIRAVYAMEVEENGQARLLRSNPEAGTFEPAESWPERYHPLRQSLLHRFRDARPLMGRLRPPFEWAIEEEIPALVLWIHRTPMMQRRLPGVFPRAARMALREPRPPGCLILELDLDYIRGELLPELAERHFADLYHVAVVNQARPEPVIYSSHPEIPFSDFSPSDARAGMLALRPEHVREFPWGEFANLRRPGLGAFPSGEGLWRVYVRHPSGSLEAAVAAVRRRNLAVSFGILLLMAATVAVILVSTRRAQNLARLQMEFVAGISHELLTPLSVIRSASDNLADGLVENRGQAEKYGALIRRESRNLTDMVRQTLDYASLEYQRRRYEFRPVDAAEVIRQALEACRPALRESALEVEEKIGPDLPPVDGDAGALTLCVRNLLTNAAKYGAGGGRIEVLAHRAGSERHPEVEITVSDRGPGIHPADLPRLFEPFYRGREAASRAHGTGLGLSLVKRILEDHGGRVTVESTSGQGSAFTLHLPASRQVRA